MPLVATGRLLTVSMFACALCLGCGSSTPPAEPTAATDSDHDHEHADHEHADHDHEHDHAQHEHEHPETYAAAVAEVKELNATLREALDKGETEKADEAVHEVGHVLEHVADLAKAETLSDADQEEVKQHVDSLFDSFGKIDEQIHSGTEVTYDEVVEKINAAIESLEQHVKK